MPQTPDLEVQGSSSTHCVVSLEKELYSLLSFFTQVYKWVPVTYYPGTGERGWGEVGCNPAMDWCPVQGGVAILLGILHAKETRISCGCLGLWLMRAFTFSLTIATKCICWTALLGICTA